MPGNQEWSTPPDMWRAIVGRFGEFDIDVCASVNNAKCPAFYTEDHDALDEANAWIEKKVWRHIYDKKASLTKIPKGEPLQDWVIITTNKAYCNPGFAKPLEWIQKAYLEAQKREDSLVLVMGLGSHSTDWFRWCYDNCYQIHDLSPRPQFVPAPGVKKSSNAHENCLFEFRHASKQGNNSMLLADKRVPWRWKP